MLYQTKFPKGNINFMTSNTATSLGIWIKTCLEEVGENQVWLANKIGVTPPQVSRIISGYSVAPPETLGAIADALGKPRIQAYRAAGYIEQVTATERDIEDIIHEVEKLPRQDQAEVLAFIRMKRNLRNK